MSKRVQSGGDGFQFNHRALFESFLAEFDLSREDICLDMSIQLFNYGIRENGDIDLVVGPEMRPKVRSIANERDDCRVTEDDKIVFREEIEVVQPERYAKFGISDREVVHDSTYHELVDGFKLTRLELVVSLKYAQARKKDREDVQAISDRGLMADEEWDWDLTFVIPPWDRAEPDPFWQRLTNYLTSEGPYGTAVAGWSKLRDDVELVDAFDAVLKNTRELKSSYQIEKLHQRGLEYHVPCSDILGASYTDERFDGWNIVLACCALSDEFDWMDDTVSERVLDIDSEFTPRSQHKVTLTENFGAVSGVEVLARQLLTEPTGTVPISVSSEVRRRRYDRGWVESLGFDNDELRQLTNFRDTLLRDSGVYFFGFVWPSAKHIADDVEQFVSARANVQYSLDVTMGDEFESFVMDLYSIDESVQEWILQKKIHECRGNSNTVRLLVFELTDPAFDYGEDIESTTAASLKDECRKAHFEEMDQYVYDNIFHVTDNYEQNRHAREVLTRYTEDTVMECLTAPNQS